MATTVTHTNTVDNNIVEKVTFQLVKQSGMNLFKDRFAIFILPYCILPSLTQDRDTRFVTAFLLCEAISSA